METLTKMVSEKAGITEQQANNAIKTVVNFLKNKLPDEYVNQLDRYASGNQSEGYDHFADELKDTLEGVYTKKP